MHNPAILEELFIYNRYANKKVIATLQQHKIAQGKGINLFSHILNAHHTWIARIKGEPVTYGVWQVHTLSQFEQIDQQNHQNTTYILNEALDLNRTISYQNSSGKSFVNSFRDILLHIVNHSTYHRGQIASIIREQGFDPPVTDYIFYKRDNT